MTLSSLSRDGRSLRRSKRRASSRHHHPASCFCGQFRSSSRQPALLTCRNAEVRSDFWVTTTEEAPPMTGPATDRHRWLALVIVCLGDLMIVLDVTIVGVALPSIRADLGFSENSLAWVANAYLLTFGGFLLLAGRLGDLFGHRRLFLIGIVIFTLASLGAGLAASQAQLVGFRAVQGLAGAIASAAALSLIVTLFTEPVER